MDRPLLARGSLDEDSGASQVGLLAQLCASVVLFLAGE